jgi:hypothetical protein
MRWPQILRKPATLSPDVLYCRILLSISEVTARGQA